MKMVSKTMALALVTMLVVVLSSNTTRAASVDINGGSSWNGWTLEGNSLDDGIWASGPTTLSFDIYTTVFALDGTESVTGSPHGNTSLSGTGYNIGSRVIGIGVVMKSEDLNEASTVPTWKFDPNNNSYAPASSLGAGDGKTSSSTYSDTGDFNVQVNGIRGQGWDWGPSFFGRNDGTSIIDYATALGATNSPFRSFAQLSLSNDITSFQLLADVNELAVSPWSANIGSDYTVVLAVPGSAGTTSIVLQNVAAMPATVIPVPAAAWAGMMLIGGLGGFRGLRRKLRRA